jgi:hypothetical protein
MALPTLDVVFASAADLPRRMMLAKWLVEELGEIQAPSNVLVSGLDVTNANGLYVRNGEENGKAAYFLNGTNTSNSQSFIVWNGDLWAIEELESGTIFSSSEDVAYPWLVTNWGFSGSEAVIESPSPSPISNYVTLPERYLWAKIAVAAGAPKDEAFYINAPKQYAWSDIYNAVSGSSAGTIDWGEKQALGHIAAAYRGDTANPANLATYIDWPWRYQVASIIDHLLGNYNAVIVSGAGTASSDGTYVLSGQQAGKGVYEKGSSQIVWSGGVWLIEDVDFGDFTYQSNDDTQFPWNANFFTLNGDEPAPTLTPTNV